jgi:hypothetical protein
MRLINVETLKLENFADAEIPERYAILSHTWGPEEEEIRFDGISSGNIDKDKKGFFKLEQCCKQAKQDGCGYAWIDTCCIVSSNSTELGKSIRSMFRWYQNATICYAYLADVPAGTDCKSDDSAFCKSRWFSRGWTLQELLAPKTVHFYGKAWNAIGTKSELSRVIEKITRIPREVLEGYQPLETTSVAQRMSWAADRLTKEPEDIAYCLLGLFGVSMGLEYGETPERAFQRLQYEIMKVVRDESILAWGYGYSPKTKLRADSPSTALSAGALARSPADFRFCDRVVSRQPHAGPAYSLEVKGGYLFVQLPVAEKAESKETFIILDCCSDDDAARSIAVALWPDPSRPSPSSEYWIRLAHQRIISVAGGSHPKKSFYIRATKSVDSTEARNRRHWIRIGELAGNQLELLDVYPGSTLTGNQGVISTFESASDVGKVGRIVRLRNKRDKDRDILLVILVERTGEKAHAVAWVNIFTCRADLQLDWLISNLKHMNPKIFIKGGARAANGFSAFLTEKLVAGHPMFVLNVTPRASSPESKDPESHTYDLEGDISRVSQSKEVITCLKQEDARRQTHKMVDKVFRRLRQSIADDNSRLAMVKDELEKLLAEKDDLEHRLEKAGPTIQEAGDTSFQAARELDETRRLKSYHLKSLRQMEPEEATFNCDDRYNEVFEKLLLMDSIARDALVIHNHPEMEKAFTAQLAPSNTLYVDDRGKQLLLVEFNQEIQRLKGMIVEDKVLEDPSFPHLLCWVALFDLESLAKLLLQGGTSPPNRSPTASDIQSAPTPGSSEIGRNVKASDSIVHANEDVCQDSKHDSGSEEWQRGIHCMDMHGMTPLSIAVERGSLTIAKLLLSAGADVDQADKKGKTPLLHAAEQGHTSVIEALHSSGCNLSRPDQDGRTAMHHAAKGGHADAVRKLIILLGGDYLRIHARDKIGKTPQDLAADLKRHSVLEIFPANRQTVPSAAPHRMIVPTVTTWKRYLKEARR